MLSISEHDIKLRLNRDNPWWDNVGYVGLEEKYPRRAYYSSFNTLALNFQVKRATVLLGPRRVGKTVMIKQLIYDAMKQGIDSKCILYASIDTPVYAGISLEKFVSLMPGFKTGKQCVVIFDEIQYLSQWEVHLKDLVDHYPEIKFIVTGSAAAALRLKSHESGAGRFSEFMLPPLTFYEFLLFIGKDEELIEDNPDQKASIKYKAVNLDLLNKSFIDYLNFGGYPEAALNPEIRDNPEQFIRNDIIDKVLLKDLPSLYGIDDIKELNRLFSFLAYNTGNEASLVKISSDSGLEAKKTIKKYIEYLESAFLVMKLQTVDDNCRSMERERNFKIYLNNPSMRAALFAPVKIDESEKIGHLVESAIFSQWQHSTGFRSLRYARWKNEGEVDIVLLGGPKQLPLWIGEIKWSDRVAGQLQKETKSIQAMLKKHKTIGRAFFTTKTFEDEIIMEERKVSFVPSALYCYAVGRNISVRLENIGNNESE